MPSTGTLGSTLPWGPKSQKVECQAPPARLSQISITGLEPRVQLGVAGRSENFFVDTGATYSVLTSYSGALFSQICTILGATGKAIMKDLPEHFFVAGMDKYFPTSF